MKTYTNTGSKDTRSGFGAGLTELGKSNSNVRSPRFPMKSNDQEVVVRDAKV